jgi:UDP-3-O-[3-hydroxymyristoyl] glucosamine N-acyltransferase
MSWSTSVAWVDREAEVGERVHIGHAATIGPGVRIGDDCRIGPGVRIGQSGFGYERDADGHWNPKPEDYGVVIENGVHVGANTCIDRGSYRDTYICPGTRIDNLVHVAHNVIIGPGCIIVAHAGLGGSCMINAGVWIGFGAHVKERVVIGELALIGMGAVILKNVPPNQTWAGNPARCINDKVGVREVM